MIATLLERSGSARTSRRSPPRAPCRSPTSRVIQFADLRFPTPSGRVELASARAEADGLPRVPLPARGRAAGRRAPAPPLAGLAVAPERQLRQRRQDRAAHRPGDRRPAPRRRRRARPRRGRRGGRRQRDRAPAALVTLSDAVPRGVAYSPKGRWPKREPARANVNVLNPGERADMGESTSVHGVEVTVEPSRA